MKRLIFCGVICATFFALSHRVALAAVEFCPAMLNLHAVGKIEAGQVAQVYGFELEAFGPRSISANLVFDTDHGWYTADLPSVAITEQDRKYYGPNTAFVRKEWASPAMYVQFPTGVVINQAWVNSALSVGDTFGWQGQGLVQCLPSGGHRDPHYHPTTGPDTTVAASFTTHDVDFLSAPPPAGAMLIVPKQSAALEKTDCSKPFDFAIPTKIAEPDISRAAGNVTGVRAAEVIVGLRADGSLADAWIAGSSGISAIDQSALNSAKESTYRNAVAYCRNVPALYYYVVTFDPDE